MRTCLVDVEGEAFALGFDWSAAGPGRTVAQVKDEGRLLGASLVVEGPARRAGPGDAGSRPGATFRQYGYGDVEAAAEGEAALFRGAASAAVRLCPETPGLLACLHLRDHRDLDAWWVFARLGGDILAGYGDRVHATAEEAQASVAALRTLLPEGAAFDEEVDLADADAASSWLAAHLARPKAVDRLLGRGRVRALARYHGNGLLYAEGALLCLILSLGLWQAGLAAYDWLTEQGVTEAARQLAHRRDLRRQFVERHPDKVWPAGWVGVLPPAVAGETCLALVREAAPSVAGWKWTGSACAFRGRTVTATDGYAYTPLSAYLGLPANARLDVGQPKKLELVRTRQGERVTGLPGDHPSFWSEKAVSAWFLQYAQKVRSTVNLRFRPRQRHEERRVGTFLCPWTAGEWSVDGIPTSALASALAPLAQVPGMRVTGLAFDRRTWKLRGEVYAK